MPQMSPVTSRRAASASKVVNSLARGGNGTAADFVSPTVGFHYSGVMFALKGCRLTTEWYSPGSGSMLSGEMTCRDGDLVAVDVTFDSNDRITKIIGQGANREFDSSDTSNRTY